MIELIGAIDDCLTGGIPLRQRQDEGFRRRCAPVSMVLLRK